MKKIRALSVRLIKKYGMPGPAKRYLNRLKWWDAFTKIRIKYRKSLRMERREFRFKYPNLFDAVKYQKQSSKHSQEVKKRLVELAFHGRNHYIYKINNYSKRFNAAKTYNQQSKIRKRMTDLYKDWIGWQKVFMHWNTKWFKKVVKQHKYELTWSNKNTGVYGVDKRVKHLKKLVSHYQQLQNICQQGQFNSFVSQLSGIRFESVQPPQNMMNKVEEEEIDPGSIYFSQGFENDHHHQIGRYS